MSDAKTTNDDARRLEEMTVLVVDDEEDIALYLASVLEDAGMATVTAHDGVEAMEVLQEEPPDLISLDLVMPRKSGIKLLMELRKSKEWRRIPVIIVTAHARDPEVRTDLDEVLAESTIAGPSTYLEKPVTPRRYLEAVCHALRVEPPPVDAEGDSSAALRQQAESLLESADAATLEAVLGELKRRRTSSR